MQKSRKRMKLMKKDEKPRHHLHPPPPISGRKRSSPVAPAAWASGIVSTWHRRDWSYGSRDRIPPGYRVVAFLKKKGRQKNNNGLHLSLDVPVIVAWIFVIGRKTFRRIRQVRTGKILARHQVAFDDGPETPIRLDSWSGAQSVAYPTAEPMPGDVLKRSRHQGVAA
jgi:hypothetical protein